MESDALKDYEDTERMFSLLRTKMAEKFLLETRHFGFSQVDVMHSIGIMYAALEAACSIAGLEMMPLETAFAEGRATYSKTKEATLKLLTPEQLQEIRDRAQRNKEKLN